MALGFFLSQEKIGEGNCRQRGEVELAIQGGMGKKRRSPGENTNGHMERTDHYLKVYKTKFGWGGGAPELVPKNSRRREP